MLKNTLKLLKIKTPIFQITVRDGSAHVWHPHLEGVLMNKASVFQRVVRSTCVLQGSVFMRDKPDIKKA